MKKKYVIIGNSAAGVSAVRTLRSVDKEAEIVCISAEVEQPYNKCLLADYVMGEKTEEQTHTITKQQSEQLRITMKLGVKVISIDQVNRHIVYADKTTESYDKLLLATGTRPMVPPIEGIKSCHNLFFFHNLYHANQLFAYIKEQCPKRALIIGAGLSGVEVADALVKQNLQVHVVERSAQLLAAHITPNGSAVIEQAMIDVGIKLSLSSSVTKIQQAHDGYAVSLSDGSCVQVDLIVVAAGTVPNNELAHQAQLSLDTYGVKVNEYLQTSSEHIYAAGDIISIVDQLSGKQMASCTWPDAMQQGRHAAYAMAGQPKRYPGASIITSSAFFGYKFYSCGPRVLPEATVFETQKGGYTRYVTCDGQLKGCMLFNDGKRFAGLKQALLTQTPLSSAILDSLTE